MRATLLADGPSDALLLHIIDWLMRDLGAPLTRLRHADSGLFPPGTKSLQDRARAAIDLEPCEILFVHRDAEKMPLAKRVAEIRTALGTASLPSPFVCLVPVRMTEVWFLFDESAIRKAAGNPNGRHALGLPGPTAVESLSDPKEKIRTALSKATNLTGRRLNRFQRDLGRAVQRVGELIDDFSPLRQLPAFRAFETEVRDFIKPRHAS